MLLTWLIAAIIFSVDCVLKTYLRINFCGQPVPLAGDFLRLTVVFNRGAAFGLLQGKTFFLIISGILLIAFFFFLFKREKKKGAGFNSACGLIIGGAFSNLYDRLTLGYVVDYIDLRIWPVFNISDACITVGVGVLVWQSFKIKRADGRLGPGK